MSLRRGIRSESTTQILDDNETNSLVRKKSKLKTYFRVTAKINVILLVIVLVLLVVKMKLYEKDRKKTKESDATYEAANSENGVCVPCNSLGNGVKAEHTIFDSIRTTKKGGKICCYKEQPHLQAMISRMMDPQLTKPIPDIDETIREKMKWWRTRPNAMHLYLDLDKLKHVKGHTTDLVWSTDMANDPLGTSYMNNMLYNRSIHSVELLHGGVYFIYAAITFDFGDISSVGLFTLELNQWHRLLPKTNTTILKSRFGGSSETKRKYTSFLCGAFKLGNSTNIMTELTPAAHVHIQKSKYANYFGIFMV